MDRALVGLAPGEELPPLAVTLSAAANDRYWAGAGIEHPARRAGLLYPPLAANLTILAVQQLVDEPLLHTRQRLVAHGRAVAPADLVVRGRCTERFAKRGREYAVVEAVVDGPGRVPLWTSTATLTPLSR